MRSGRGRAAVASCALAMAAIVAPASAQAPRIILLGGAPLPGGLEGHVIDRVSGVDAPTVNHAGGYAFTILTHDANHQNVRSQIWGNAAGGSGTVLRTGGTYGSLVQLGIGRCGMSNDGSLAYQAQLQHPTLYVTSGWHDDLPLGVTNNAVPTLPGYLWYLPDSFGMTADGRPYWVSSLRSTTSGPITNWGIFIDDEITPLLSGGQQLPGLKNPLALTGPVPGVHVSPWGSHYLARVKVEPPSLEGPPISPTVMVMDGEPLQLGGSLVIQGNTVPASIGGVAGERWSFFQGEGINEAGQYFFGGRTDVGPYFLVVNGQMIYRAGQVVDGFTLIGLPSQGAINEDGDIAISWGVTQPTGDGRAIFLNGREKMKVGDHLDMTGDGIPDPFATLTRINRLALSDRDSEGTVRLYIAVEAEIVGAPSEVSCGVVLVVEHCEADVNDSGAVDVSDLLAVINSWGPCVGCSPVQCPTDVSPDCAVNVSDLLLVINNWGPCP